MKLIATGCTSCGALLALLATKSLGQSSVVTAAMGLTMMIAGLIVLAALHKAEKQD